MPKSTPSKRARILSSDEKEALANLFHLYEEVLPFVQSYIDKEASGELSRPVFNECFVQQVCKHGDDLHSALRRVREVQPRNHYLPFHNLYEYAGLTEEQRMVVKSSMSTAIGTLKGLINRFKATYIPNLPKTQKIIDRMWAIRRDGGVGRDLGARVMVEKKEKYIWVGTSIGSRKPVFLDQYLIGNIVYELGQHGDGTWMALPSLQEALQSYSGSNKINEKYLRGLVKRINRQLRNKGVPGIKLNFDGPTARRMVRMSLM